MALRQINFVPPEIVTRRFLMRHLNLWAGCLVASLCLVSSFFVYQSRVVLADTVSQEALRGVTAKLSVKIEAINRLREEVEEISNDQSIMDAVSGKHAYSQVLLELSTILDRDTWLSLLAVDSSPGETGPLKMRLNGYSISNEALGGFINRLSSEPTFNEVVLRFSREGQITDQNQSGDAATRVIQFLIEFDVF